MKIGIPVESDSQETRSPLTPTGVKGLVDLGADILVGQGVGQAAGYPDREFEAAGGHLHPSQEVLQRSDLLLRVGPSSTAEVALMTKGAILASFLDPFQRPELLTALAEQGVSALSMEMIPRSTRAQKMDALSSQANLAGYVAVLLAARNLNRILPMMTTPAGTIPPAKVFIIGAGVAGLQACATAKRLGARVEAFDTRPEVEEQVRSVGARFFKVDLGETASTEQGYARALSKEQLETQQKAMEKTCHQSDVVITTAQVFGRRAPLIIKGQVMEGMKPGSVLVDLAVETGGNIEGSVAGEIVQVGNARIIGLRNLPGLVPFDSSRVYSNNLTNLVAEFWDGERQAFHLNRDDEIIQSALVTHDGSICHERFKQSS